MKNIAFAAMLATLLAAQSAAQADCVPTPTDASSAHTPSATDRHADGLRAATAMMGAKTAAAMETAPRSGEFGGALHGMALDDVYGGVWSRCNLSWRDRSLVTLGILIALRADNELRIHFEIARKNGVTRAQAEEVIYQAAAYAGYPAASDARAIAAAVYDKP